MPLDTPTARVSKKMLWAGWIMSALPVLMLLFSGVMKLVKPEPVVEGFKHLGWDDSLALGLGILEIACTDVYVYFTRPGLRHYRTSETRASSAFSGRRDGPC